MEEGGREEGREREGYCKKNAEEDLRVRPTGGGSKARREAPQLPCTVHLHLHLLALLSVLRLCPVFIQPLYHSSLIVAAPLFTFLSTAPPDYPSYPSYPSVLRPPSAAVPWPPLCRLAQFRLGLAQLRVTDSNLHAFS